MRLAPPHTPHRRPPLRGARLPISWARHHQAFGGPFAAANRSVLARTLLDPEREARLMAVKADGPADVDRSTEQRGSSVATAGLTALDEEREASLADEGGASGAVIESQDLDTLRRIASDHPGGHLQSPDSRRRRPGFWFVAGARARGAVSVLASRKRR